MKIVADQYIPFIKEYFENHGQLILKMGRDISRADVQDADILLVRSVTPVNKDLLDNTSVKFVGSITTGADHLDTQWLNEAGIAFANVHGFNAPPVADYVVSVIAALHKKNILGQERMKAAVIGIGRIGYLVCEHLKQLNFDIILCDPLRQNNEENFFSVPIEEIDDVDLITLHVPLVRQGEHPTYHFIDKNFLTRQKENCVLVNASRGAVIDSEALLQYGTHLKWCFDVWEDEPKINQSILQQAAIATPHIAGYSIQSKMRGIAMMYQLMVDKKIIDSQITHPVNMPTQKLLLTHKMYTWQEVVLEVFNPLLMTDMVKAALLAATSPDAAFDQLRNQFHDRHEFAYTEIAVNGSASDAQILKNLGFKQVS